MRTRPGGTRVFELRYQGETVGWATLTEGGALLEPANEDLDAHLMQQYGMLMAAFAQVKAA